MAADDDDDGKSEEASRIDLADLNDDGVSGMEDRAIGGCDCHGAPLEYVYKGRGARNTTDFDVTKSQDRNAKNERAEEKGTKVVFAVVRKQANAPSPPNYSQSRPRG
jgi:hypothetical protein